MGQIALGFRVFPALLLLPLGGLGARLGIALVISLYLGSLSPALPSDPLSLTGELLYGLSLGLAVALPAQLMDSSTLKLAPLGGVWAWALFFGMGGPGLWLLALSEPGPFPEPQGLFRALFLLALPVWLPRLALGLSQAWAERATGLKLNLSALALLLSLWIWALALPLLSELLDQLWRGLLNA